jgi:hypothetical protein
MLKPQAQGVVNPIEVFVERHISRYRQRAVPLVDTAYDVVFEAGLAVIEARRVFRNNESSSIEAVLTFPMPVHAAIFDLEAKLGGHYRSSSGGRFSHCEPAWLRPVSKRAAM